MTCSPAEVGRPRNRRLALVAVVALVAAGFFPGLDLTAAKYQATASGSTVISTQEPCLWNQGYTVSPYTSTLLDAASPLLRWSFTDGALPDGVAAAADEGQAVPTVAAGGLLACDPAVLAEPAALPGSLVLASGAAGSRVSAATPLLPDAFTLVFWTSISSGPGGELATLTNTSGDLVVGLAGATPDAAFGTVSLTAGSTGGATTVTSGSVADGAAHLVALTVVAGRATLTVDGATPAGVDTTWAAAPTILTIGARATASSPATVIDEVTVLAGAYDGLAALVAADVWWDSRPALVPTS